MTYEEGYKKIWSVFNAMRDAFDMHESGVIVMYLIILYNNRGFRDSIGSVEGITWDRLCGAVCGAVQSDESGRSKVLLDVLDILSPEMISSGSGSAAGGGRFGILQYRPSLLEDVFGVISSIGDDWYEEHLPRLFDKILFYWVENIGKRGFEYVQPLEVTKLVTALSGYDGRGSVYNPYAGAASYAVEMKPSDGYVGEELNNMTWGIAVMRMMAHGLDPRMISRNNSLEHWRGIDLTQKYGQRFDYIVSTPPFSVPIRRNGDPFRTFRLVEEDFLYRGAMALSENGVLTGVFPTGVTFRETPPEKTLRRDLVDAGLVSKVILLPSNLFYGCAIPSVIIQLRNSQPSDRITMVDASTFFKKVQRRNILDWEGILSVVESGEGDHVKSVTISEVAKNGYSLHPARYFVEEEAKPEGYKAFKVSDIIMPVASSVSGNDSHGRTLNPADLSKDAFANAVKAETLSVGELKPGLNRMTEPFIAISRTGALRPTPVEASVESPVYVGTGVLPFFLKEGLVYQPLFLMEWRRRSEALPDYGDTIKRKSMKDALDQVLFLPATIEEQQSLYVRLEQQDKLAKARELGLEEVIAAQKRDFINVLRNRKHDLDNCLGAAQHDFSALSKCLKRVKVQDADFVDSALSEDVDITVGDQLKKIKNLLDRMSFQIKHFTDENVFGEAEKVDLNAKLAAIQPHGNYTVVREYDQAYMPHEEGSILKPCAFVRFCSADLDRVIDNIIRNAEKHGFKVPDKKYTLKISLSYDYSDKMYAVEFQNNGSPMPKGMDTLRYGIDGERGKDSEGLGKGGSIVKSIVEHFGGKYEVFNEPDALFPVGILIKLPKYED